MSNLFAKLFLLVFEVAASINNRDFLPVFRQPVQFLCDLLVNGVNVSFGNEDSESDIATLLTRL